MSDRGWVELVVPADFDEADYLAANHDVAAVVARGGMQSGLQHYIQYGARENRSLRPGVRAVPFKLPFAPHWHPSRRDKILAGLDLPRLDGVEIGALASPLVTRAEGNIFYVDFTGTAALQDYYRHHGGVDTSAIVAVDAIWGDNTLQDCIGLERKVDYVVASHVVEHCPDLITWLREISDILRPGGTLRLAVPDRRYSFDYLRHETRLPDVLDAFLRRARAPLPRAILDHYTFVVFIDHQAAWAGEVDAASLIRKFTVQEAMAHAEEALHAGHYFDVHCWVFTPKSFAGLLAEMAELDLIHFACHYWFDTARNEAEFTVGMNVCEDRAERIASWRRMQSGAV